MDTPDPTSTLPPPTRPPFEGRRLRRRPEDGPIGGVCAGIADYLAVDVTVVRLAAVLLAVLGPGIPAYVVAWVVIPAARPGEPWQATSHAGTPVVERVPQYVGTGLLVLAAVIVWHRLDWPGDRFLLPLALIGAGVVLLARSGTDDPDGPDDLDRRPHPPSSWSLTEPLTASTVSATTATTATTTMAPPPPPPPPPTFFDDEYEPAPSTPPRRRSPVAAVFFGAALVWGGIAFLIDMTPETALAVAVGILGIGLVVGAFAGGARALIFPGVLLSLLLVATAVLDVPLRGGIGDREWDVDSAADAGEPFRLAIGEAELDLRDLRPGAERTVTVEASVAIGHLIVHVPEGVDVDIDAEADAGEIVILGRSDDGVDVHVERELNRPPATGTIELHVAVGLGQLEVIG